MFEFRKIWWNKFADIVDDSQIETIIIGDFNIHLIEELDHNENNNCPDIEGVDRILMKVFDLWRTKNPINKFFSYIKGNQFTRIDYALISPNMEDFLEVIYLPFNVDISIDHCPVVIKFNKEDMEESNILSNFWKRKFFNCNNFKILEKRLSFSNLSEAMEFNSDSSINDLSYNILKSLKDICVDILGYSERVNQYEDVKLPFNIKCLQNNFNRIKNAIASFPMAKINNCITLAISNLNLNSHKYSIPKPTLNRLGWLQWRGRADMMSKFIYKELRKEMRKFNIKKINKQVEFILNLEKKNPKVFNRKFNWKKQEMSNFSLDKLKLRDGSVTSVPSKIISELTSFWSKIFVKDHLACLNNAHRPGSKQKHVLDGKTLLVKINLFPHLFLLKRLLRQ